MLGYNYEKREALAPEFELLLVPAARHIGQHHAGEILAQEFERPSPHSFEICKLGIRLKRAQRVLGDGTPALVEPCHTDPVGKFGALREWSGC